MLRRLAELGRRAAPEPEVPEPAAPDPPAKRIVGGVYWPGAPDPREEVQRRLAIVHEARRRGVPVPRGLL